MNRKQKIISLQCLKVSFTIVSLCSVSKMEKHDTFCCIYNKILNNQNDIIAFQQIPSALTEVLYDIVWTSKASQISSTLPPFDFQRRSNAHLIVGNSCQSSIGSFIFTAAIATAFQWDHFIGSLLITLNLHLVCFFHLCLVTSQLEGIRLLHSQFRIKFTSSQLDCSSDIFVSWQKFMKNSSSQMRSLLLTVSNDIISLLSPQLL